MIRNRAKEINSSHIKTKKPVGLRKILIQPVTNNKSSEECSGLNYLRAYGAYTYSSSVLKSPSGNPNALAFNTLRIILPLRVLGRTSV